MKTDTLTGPNLSYHVAVLDGEKEVSIRDDLCLYLGHDDCYWSFNYADPATFQPIAEREGISITFHEKYHDGCKWQARTKTKCHPEASGKYYSMRSAYGSTMAEAMMRCYVKSYLGDDTKGE